MQRALTDFDVEIPFADVRDKIRERCGIHIAKGSAATIIEGHARKMTDTAMTTEVRPTKDALTLIAQIDGSMIPMVQTGQSDDNATQDRRIARKLFWKEGEAVDDSTCG